MLFQGIVVLLFVLLYSYICSWEKTEKKVKLPPGPKVFPLIGNAEWFFSSFPGRVLYNIGKKYGPIACVRLGKHPVHLINNIYVWKELFRRYNLSGRAPGVLKRLSKEQGILFTNDVREQRHYIFKAFKSFSDNDNFEFLMQEDVSAVLKKFTQSGEQPFLIDNIFAIPTVNVLWSLLFGTRINDDNVGMSELVKNIKSATGNSMFFGRKSFINMIPGISKIFPNLSRSKMTKDAYNQVCTMIEEEVQRQRDTRVNNEVRHLTDDFNDNMRKNRGNQKSYFGRGDPQSKLFGELFLAAVDSTSTTLNWLVLFLSLNIQVQKKFQQEIDNVIGSEIPSLIFQDEMPYTLAIIQETLRLSAIVALQIHQATEDTQILGYNIPKHSLVLPNTFQLCWDPEIWSEPETFKPERFIEDGKYVGSDKMAAFGFGKRSCIGEAIARKQLFLFAVGIFQKFDVVFVGKRPRLEGLFGFFHAPHPFKVTFKTRKYKCNLP